MNYLTEKYIVTETEIEIVDNEIIYVDRHIVVAAYFKNEAQTYIEERVRKLVADGFFNNVVIETSTNVVLNNGGSFNKILEIINTADAVVYR